MDLTNWVPLRDLNRIFNRVHPLTSRLDEDGPGLEILNADLKWRPAADISETEDEFTIKADLPEVEKDDIQLDISDGMLTLKGERKYEKKSEKEKQHRVESFHGSFERSFSLPANVDEDNIHAESSKGVLTVHLPKQPAPQAEKRQVKVE